jgi:septal ring factor EnvC (AmiA/AmiB activator)
MLRNRTHSPTRKILPAVFATLGMTAFIVIALFAVGLNALVNQNVSVAKAAAPAETQVSDSQATAQNLQATISQYQNRETQYQDQLKQAADQISQLNQQNQQYKQLFTALQNAGVIQITQDGRVFVNPGAGLRDSDDDNH